MHVRDAALSRSRAAAAPHPLQARVVRVREATGAAIEALSALDSAYAQIYRDHPFHESPDFVGRVRALLAEGRFTLPLELP